MVQYAEIHAKHGQCHIVWSFSGTYPPPTLPASIGEVLQRIGWPRLILFGRGKWGRGMDYFGSNKASSCHPASR